jgi:hypothetical protein
MIYPSVVSRLFSILGIDEDLGVIDVKFLFEHCFLIIYMEAINVINIINKGIKI